MIKMNRRLLSPEPPTMTQAIMKLSSRAFGRIEKAYIECVQDHVMQAALPRCQVISLDASHPPFLSRPRR